MTWPFRKKPERSPRQGGLPRFPSIKWEGVSWITSVDLPSWTGFQVRKGPYGSVSGPGESDGVVQIVLSTRVDERDGSSIKPEETAAVRWLVEHERGAHDTMMQLLFEAYPEAREQAMEWLQAEEAEELAPRVASAAELKRLCGVVAVYVFPSAQGAPPPHLGVELGCTWEVEHGVGVLLHGERVLKWGQADTAFSFWSAEERGRTVG